MAVIEVSDASFEQEVIKSDIPVLVDFWAPWCGPCRMIALFIEEIAEMYEGKIKVVKLDIDQNSVTPRQHGIRSIPTLLVFKDGERTDAIVGAVPKSTVVNTLDKYL